TVESKLDVLRQPRVELWQRRVIAAAELLAQHPARVCAQLPSQRPGMPWIHRVESLDRVLLKGLADRLEELPAVLLHQRLEKRQAEHLALALVNARGKEVVDIVAEDVALEE